MNLQLSYTVSPKLPEVGTKFVQVGSKLIPSLQQGIDLGSLWGHLGVRDSLCGIWRSFWDTGRSFGGHSGVALGRFGVIVPSFWCYFGVMWVALWAYGGAISSPWVTLGLLWPHFGIIVESLLGYEGGFGGLGGCVGVTLISL